MSNQLDYVQKIGYLKGAIETKQKLIEQLLKEVNLLIVELEKESI